MIYPLTFPAIRGPARVTNTGRATVGTSTSPFTQQQQVYVHAGEIFALDIELPPMRAAEGQDMIGFLLGLNGMEGTFVMPDWEYKGRRGPGTGDPRVNGAGQTGKTLITDGWTPSTAGILKRGDEFQLGTLAEPRLHKLTADANSDASGNATLSIWPRLRSSPADNAVLTVDNPQGLWRMASNDTPWSVGAGGIYTIRFSCREAL